MVKKYIPSKGDIILFDFSPTKGHEQNGYRPAIVISHNFFNEHTKMMIACPISSNIKNFPTHYTLVESKKIKGAVLCEHIRSIDYEQRKIKFVEKASNADLIAVLSLLDACLNE